ncbi:MAG: hypothetical protein AVDCRST_MAG56-7575 [uncultured Cytophagales bacterium]|uniref:Uncharacterized protein n=1 Tax=uncultured Cytophagales bacterium TaxID=158755 RepID=A0A6J4LKL3_9SPHI|nr:MAG: hypothetical protein AVDCRST_MAG56-7575 [uncultured Cytophagales bacterium]
MYYKNQITSLPVRFRISLTPASLLRGGKNPLEPIVLNH